MQEINAVKLSNTTKMHETVETLKITQELTIRKLLGSHEKFDGDREGVRARNFDSTRTTLHTVALFSLVCSLYDNIPSTLTNRVSAVVNM